MVEDKKTPEKKVVKKQAKGQVVYVGDNLAPGLIHGTVFLDGVPPIVNLDKNPLLERLFVPIEGLTKALKDVKEEGTPLYMANKMLKEGGVDLG